jgi:hypothetical protein
VIRRRGHLGYSNSEERGLLVEVDEKERGRVHSFICPFRFKPPPTLGGFPEALTCGVCLPLQASTPRSLERPHLDAIYSIQVGLNCGNIRT